MLWFLKCVFIDRIFFFKMLTESIESPGLKDCFFFIKTHKDYISKIQLFPENKLFHL